jgi:hypothetical protein
VFAVMVVCIGKSCRTNASGLTDLIAGCLIPQRKMPHKTQRFFVV